MVYKAQVMIVDAYGAVLRRFWGFFDAIDVLAFVKVNPLLSGNIHISLLHIEFLCSWAQQC